MPGDFFRRDLGGEFGGGESQFAAEPLFVEDAHVLVLGDVGLVADDAIVLEQLAAKLNARIVVVKFESDLQDKVLKSLLRGQK